MAFALTAAACGDDTTGGSGTDGASGGSVTSAGGADAGGADAGDGADSTGPGACAFECQVAADCCAGSLYTVDFPCPGPYPNNWTCVAGECVNECGSSSECILPGWQCLPVGAVDMCFKPCSSNADCNEETLFGTTCTGSADNGVKYCKPDAW